MFRHRRFFYATLIVVLGLLCAAGWYVCTKGFTRPWRTFIAGEFAKRGVELTIQRLTLDPFRGLVARDVKLYEARSRHRVLAVIDEMQLGVNYAQAIRGGGFLDSVDLREARLSLPIDPDNPDSPKIEASRLNARLFLPPQQIYLARGEAEIFGVQVYATGRLINPAAFLGRHESNPATSTRISAVLELLQSLRYPGKPPVLSLEFSGDLARPEEMAIDARLSAESVRRKSYVLSKISAVASYRRGVLQLQQLAASDKRGEIRGAGSFTARDSTFTARLQSTLALYDLVRAYGLVRHLETLVLRSAPKLDLTIEGALLHPHARHVFGHVELEKFAFRGVVFEGFTSDLSWTQGSWSFRDLHLRHRSGEMTGDLVLVPHDFHARLQGELNPRELGPVITGPFTDWLAKFDFVDPPKVSLELQGTKPTFAECSADGEIRFGRSSYEGTTSQDMVTHVHYGENTLSLAPFRRSPKDPSDNMLLFDLRNRQLREEKMPAPGEPAAAPATEEPPHASS